MSVAHRYIGWSIVVAFALIAVYGLVGRVLRRPELGRPFWGLVYYTESVLVVQVVIGVVLLFLGRRVGTGFDLHYLYGSVFPLIAAIGGRIYNLRWEEAEREHPYVPIAFGALIAFGLTTRALMTGLGLG